MIPIGLPSYDFVLLRLGYLVATLFWIVWALRLVIGGGGAGRLRGWRGPLFLLLGGIAAYSLWSVDALRRHLNAAAAENRLNYHPVLAPGQRLGGIDMPAGTTLDLALAQQHEAFTRAEFPHPVLVGGVEALRAERYLSWQSDADHRTTGVTPQNLRLTGVGESLQAGWRCDATRVIVFDTGPDGAITAFQSCSASGGNLIEGQPLPPGAEILVSEGRVFLDGRRGLDRWLIHLPQDAEFQFGGVGQSGGALLLDAERKVIERIAQ